MYKAAKMPDHDTKEDMKIVSLWMNQEHRARLETKGTQILAEIGSGGKPSASDDLFLPLPAVSHLQGRKESHPTSLRDKIRNRTKQESSGANLEECLAGMAKDQLSLVMVVEPIAVTKRSYATFRSMFPETTEERQRSVDWDAFVSALEDAGLAPKNGGGSIVTFDDARGSRKISFYRPHPVPIIDPIMLRAMGRRLNKWFGWDRASFTQVTE